MSIFRRDQDSTMTPQRPKSALSQSPLPAVTQIARGSCVAGQITGAAGVRIDGEFEGEIDVDHDVNVGPTGAVRGEIKARSVRVGGKVKGNVRGQSRVELEDTGSLQGDIAAPRVVISEGAFFKGQVEMISEGGADKPLTPQPSQVSSAPASPMIEPNLSGSPR